jgi:hypothetical protein
MAVQSDCLHVATSPSARHWDAIKMRTDPDCRRQNTQPLRDLKADRTSRRLTNIVQGGYWLSDTSMPVLNNIALGPIDGLTRRGSFHPARTSNCARSMIAGIY